MQAEIVKMGPQSIQKVALTFDDGPLPGQTERLLSILRQYHIRATFFVVGKLAMQHPDLILKMIEDGHEVASHSFSHQPMDVMTDLQIYLELVSTQSILERLTGRSALYFRPPGGRYDGRVSNAAERVGLKTVLWTVNGCDAEPAYGRPARPYSNSKEMSLYLVSRVTNGGIFLLHNGSVITCQALPEFISYLRDRGFQFDTVSGLLKGY